MTTHTVTGAALDAAQAVLDTANIAYRVALIEAARVHDAAQDKYDATEAAYYATRETL